MVWNESLLPLVKVGLLIVLNPLLPVLTVLTTNWDGVGALGMSTNCGATLGAALISPGPGSAVPDAARWLASLAANLIVAVGLEVSWLLLPSLLLIAVSSIETDWPPNVKIV